MHINIFWNFLSNVFTLTICFIVLNTAVEFVLIYRPHPVNEYIYAFTSFYGTNFISKIFIFYSVVKQF
jgi:hypothetical protein